MNSDIKAQIKMLASKTLLSEPEEGESPNPWPFCPGEVFGGNLDDAYYGGCGDGRIRFARELLKKLEEL